MNNHVLLGGPAPLIEAATLRLGHLELGTSTDGAQLFARYLADLKSNRPAALVVVDLEMPHIGGAGFVQAMRAVERAWALRPTAVLIYAEGAADAALKSFMAAAGQTVHLERPAQHAPADQAARLQLAVDRLLTQLKGA